MQVMIHHFKEFEAQLETNQTIEFELDQVEFKLLNRSDRLWSVNVMNTSKVSVLLLINQHMQYIMTFSGNESTAIIMTFV